LRNGAAAERSKSCVRTCTIKGGDYDMAHVPEAQLARTRGRAHGRNAFAHDRSTTALVQRLRAAK